MYVTVRWKSVRCFEVSAKQLKQKAIIIEASSVTYTERVSMCGAEASREFISVGDWNFGSAISLILAVLILIFMSLMKKMDKDE